ncbi:MAG: hypothetical protein KDD03_12035 [Gelidibacter sp.]|nr:hypothetical protein [Gelidibacter sp.]
MKTVGYVILILIFGIVIFKEDKSYKEVELPLPELRTYNIEPLRYNSQLDSVIDKTEKNLKYLKYVEP